MKLFRGMPRSDYQDVLRALGYFIDDNGYVDVRLIESENGLVFQGRKPDRNNPGEQGFDTFLITDDEIKVMVRDSYRRRGQPAPGYSQ